MTDFIVPQWFKRVRRSKETDDEFQLRLVSCYKNELEKRAVSKEIWKAKNINRCRSYGIKHRANNLEKCRQQDRDKYRRNIEKETEGNLSYREKVRSDPDLSAKRREYRRNYRLKRKQYDSQFVAQECLRSSLNTNVKKYTSGSKHDSARSLLGCTMEEFVKYIENQFQPGMTWIPKNFHLDHKKPCSSFNLLDLEQQKACFHYTNFQPLWPAENLQKGPKMDWERGFPVDTPLILDYKDTQTGD